MLLSQTRYFLFDLDGTLVESSVLHEQAFREVLEREHPRALRGFHYEVLKGLSTRDAFGRLGLIDPAQLDGCVQEKQRLYRESVAAGKLLLMKGAWELLSALLSAGRSCSLVTSGSARSVAAALSAGGLSDIFDAVVTAEDVSRGKPAPDPYLTCLARCGWPARLAVAIEDADSGVASARAAGLKVIGVHNAVISASVDTYFGDLHAFARAFEAALPSETEP